MAMVAYRQDRLRAHNTSHQTESTAQLVYDDQPAGSSTAEIAHPDATLPDYWDVVQPGAAVHVRVFYFDDDIV